MVRQGKLFYCSQMENLGDRKICQLQIITCIHKLLIYALITVSRQINCAYL
jgi:hypothetical protein